MISDRKMCIQRRQSACRRKRLDKYNGIGRFELTIELLWQSKLDLSRFAAQMTKIILKIVLFCHYFALSFRKAIVLRID